MCLNCVTGLWAGAKLDAFLAARAGGPPSFDRKLVLLRYHHRISAWDSLRYRWALLQVNVRHPRSDLFSFCIVRWAGAACLSARDQKRLASPALTQVRPCGLHCHLKSWC